MTKLFRWLPALIIMTIIFGLSSVRGEVVNATPAGNPMAQVVGHFALFFSLCLAYYYATGSIFLAFLFTISYGVFDELHQIRTPMRSPSIFDIKVDTVGAAVASSLILIIKQFTSKRTNELKS